MPVPPVGATTTPPSFASRRAETPAEAARQFEEILIRQFVQTMTKELFQPGEGGGISGMQADAQRDALTDALTRQLSTTDALGLRDLLGRRFAPSTEAPASEGAATAAFPGDYFEPVGRYESAERYEPLDRYESGGRYEPIEPAERRGSLWAVEAWKVEGTVGGEKDAGWTDPEILGDDAMPTNEDGFDTAAP